MPCPNCDEGEIEGECTCGESVCCCVQPTPPACSVCDGKGFLIVTELTDDNCQDAVEIVEPSHA